MATATATAAATTDTTQRAARLRRELSDEAVYYQAEALADYARRGGVVSRWLDSRDLLPGDREAILAAWAAWEER